MTTVVVTGSNNDFQFAVTDISNAKAPTTVLVNPGFGALEGPPRGPTNNGCVVACSSLFTDGDISGSLVAVGHFGGSQVAIYDLSDPASPQRQATFDTGLGSIGALSLCGNNLLVGENNGSGIALLDISKAQSNAIVSTVSDLDFADGGITSIALYGSLAVVAGVYAFDALDYTNPASPVIMPYILQSASGPYVCDFDGSTAALGDNNGMVTVFHIQAGIGASVIGQSSSGLDGITSIAVQSGNAIQVAAGNYATAQVSLITFNSTTGPTPSANSVTVGSGAGDAGGAVAFYGLPNLFANTNNGKGFTWLNTEVWPNTSVVGVAANANLAAASVSTLGIAYFPTVIRLPWPWRLIPLPGWLLALLARLFGS
jgi:hypothetical protein